MSNVSYEFINDRKKIFDKINSLENLATDSLLQTDTLCIEDLYLFSAIDKSLKLIDSFLFAFNNKNITVLATLTRLQIDCVLRSFASTLVKNSTSFCLDIISGKKQINQCKDINNQFMKDKYLCQELEKTIHLDIYRLYQKVSDYVHLSSSSFKNMTNINEGNKLKIFIGKSNNPEDENTNSKLSLELANHFYYFAKILITVILKSWMKQKKQENI